MGTDETFTFYTFSDNMRIDSTYLLCLNNLNEYFKI